MKRLSVLLCCVLLLSACSSLRQKPMKAWTPPPVAAPAEPRMVDANGVPIEVVPFRPGVSSVTVERMANQAPVDQVVRLQNRQSRNTVKAGRDQVELVRAGAAQQVVNRFP